MDQWDKASGIRLKKAICWALQLGSDPMNAACLGRVAAELPSGKGPVFSFGCFTPRRKMRC